MRNRGMVAVGLALLAVVLAAIFGWQRFAGQPSVVQLAARMSDAGQQDDSAHAVSRGGAESNMLPAEGRSGEGATPDEPFTEGPSSSVSGAERGPRNQKSSGNDKTASAVADAASVDAPVFDIVHVDGNGHLVLAGRARPNTTVVVMVDGRAIGMASVDEQGNWAFDTDDEPPLRTTHQITLRMEDETERVLAQSPQSISVSMQPVAQGGQPLVVLAAPDTPSRILQQPGTVARQPGPRQQQDVAAFRRADRRAATAAGEAELTAALKQAREETARGMNTGVARETDGGGRKGGKQKASVQLLLRTVDYDSNGDIFFTGRGVPGAALRLYVDNRHLADVRADQAGNWTWRGQTQIAPGRHALRVDRLDASGRVVERIELPFVRETRQVVVAARARAAVSAKDDGNAPARAAMPETPARPGAPEGMTAHDSARTEDAAAMPAQAIRKSMAAAPTAKVEPGSSGKRAMPRPVADAAGASPRGREQDGTHARTGLIVVQPGNNLWNISRVIYGKGVRYTTIYEVNRQQIRDPNLIYPGQVFAAPGVPGREIRIDPRRKRPASPEELRRSEILR